jgi:ABC-type glycerol-3-phosphate transport system permease component
MFTRPPTLPEYLKFSNYSEVFKEWNFINLAGNTLFVVFSSMVIALISSTFVAYGFSRFQAKGKNLMFMILLSTVMLPWVVTLVPSYIIFTKLGWIGTYYPLIIPAIGGGAYNIFLLRQYFMGIPITLDEAASIDGCSKVGTLFKIMLPQCVPIIATLIVFSFNAGWSDYVGPSIYLTGYTDKYTLSIGLTTFKNSYGEMPWPKIMAACVIFAIPSLILLFAAQDAFTKGIVTSGIKD